MTMPSANRIQREMVDIHCFGERDSLALRQRVEELCTQRLTRAIGGLLDACGVPEDQLVAIDRLQVDVAGLTSRDLESELIPKIILALKEALEAKIGVAGQIKPGLARPVRRSLFEEILFFLERGYLPWTNGGGTPWAAAAAEVLSNLEPADRQRLVEQLRHAASRQRCLRHFPEAMLRRILPEFDPGLRLLLADLETLWRQLPPGPQQSRLRERLLQLLLDAALPPERADLTALCGNLARALQPHFAPAAVSQLPLQSPHLRRAFASDGSERAEPDGIAKPADEAVELSNRLLPALAAAARPPGRNRTEPVDAAAPAREPDPIYIRNAGLVILAPYLPAFFQKLELADDERLLEIPTALALLHYLAFGTDECAEWDLVLNKLICGVPLRQAIETPLPLAPGQKAEADRLLEAVIANWPALKHTSPDGLRATFLQRDGALRQQGDDWHLLLTRTGFDVLLDRLPWTISMIQLPWMPWLLRTDWTE